MFFMREGEKLYLRNWEYNTALMLDELEKIVVNMGGTVKTQTSGYIVNATIYDKIEDARHNKAVFTSHIDLFKNKPELREKAIAAANKYADLEKELQAVADRQEAVKVNHLSYITFYLDGFVYYFQTDSNPLFPFYFSKAKLDKNGTYSRDAGLEESKKEWLWDSFFNADRLCWDDLREAAYILFNELVGAAPSKIIRDGRKQRVANTYDGGWHYETVYAPERREKLDF